MSCSCEPIEALATSKARTGDHANRSKPCHMYLARRFDVSSFGIVVVRSVLSCA